MSRIASTSASSRPALRRALRGYRSAMSRAARAAAELRIRAALARAPWLRAGTTVGLYVSRDTEVSTAPLRALARQRGCRVYLPRITDFAGHRLALIRDLGRPMRRNRYRIAEPVGAARIAPPALAVVLMPLVGFDDAGNRLGNGAGYYDRLLAGRLGRTGAPVLVGIAFECQRCQALATAPHDVPLDAVITERGLQLFKPRR